MTDAAPRVAHPGAICPVQGETAVSKNGTPLYCRLPPGNPNAPHKRWGAVDPRQPKTRRRRGAARKGQGLEKRYVDQLTLEHDAPLPQQLLDQLDVKQLGALRTAGGLTWTGKKARKTDLDKLKRAGLLTDEGKLTSRGAEVLRQTGQLGEDGCDADERDAFERHGERPAPKPIVKGQPVDRSADAGTDWSAYDPCPKCPAEAGQPCHDLRAPGSLKATPHLGRMQSDMTPELKKALGEVYREPTLQIAGRAKDEFVGERVRIESTDNFGNPEVFEGVLEDVELPPEGPHNPWGGRPTAKVTLVGQEHPLPISPHAKVTVVAEAAPAEDRSADAGVDWSQYADCGECGSVTGAPCADLSNPGSFNAYPHEGRLRLASKVAPASVEPVAAPVAEPATAGSAAPDKVRSDLNGVDSTEAAGRYIDDLNLNKAELKKLADGLGIAVPSNASKAELARQIVHWTVGRRLTSQAISRPVLRDVNPAQADDRSTDSGVDWSRYKACPTCGTGPGEPCLDLRGDGSLNATAHDGRPVVAEEPAVAEPATVAEPVAEPAAATAAPEPIDLDDPGLGTDDFTRDTLDGFSEGFLTPDEMVAEMITGDGIDPVVADAYVREAVDLHNHRNPDRPLPYPGEAKSEDRSASAGTDWSKYADCHDCPAKAGAPCIDQAIAGSLNAIPHKGRPLLAGPAAEKPLAERITDVVDDLSTRPGGPVSLAELRNRLADVPREDLDQALLDLDDNRAIQLEPDPDRAGLTAADRDAAIPLVGQPQHLLRNVIRDPEDQPMGRDMTEESTPVVTPEQAAAAYERTRDMRAHEVPDDVLNAAVQHRGDLDSYRREMLVDEAVRRANPVDPSVQQVDGFRAPKPELPNGWGTGMGEVSYHGDGITGRCLDRMGGERMINVDGEPLANHAGRIATRVTRCQITPEQGLAEMRKLRDRTPEGSAARRGMDAIVAGMGCPQSPPPALPDTAPEPVRRLMNDLHEQFPLVRRDGRETEKLAEIVRDWQAGDRRTVGLALGRRLADEVAGAHHESDSDRGRIAIDRRVQQCVKELEEMRQGNRMALYPPQ